MEELLFRNTRKHEDRFATGDISKEFVKQKNEFDQSHITLEAVEMKRKSKEAPDLSKKPAYFERLAHGVDYELERPKHKAHVGFSRLYTEIEAGDSEYMKLVRTCLGRFYDYKELAKDKGLSADQKEWVLEAQLNALANLLEACDKYASNRKIRLFKKARARREDVRKLKVRAEKEISTLKVRYAKFMDAKAENKEEALQGANNAVIKIKAAKGKKGKRTAIDLSQLDLNVNSDREMYSQKHHMAIRSELDLKREDLTQEEKKLLTQINEYANIRSNAALIEHFRKMDDSKEKKKAKKAYKKEIKLYSEIAASLEEMKKNGNLSEEKEKLFSLYMNNILSLKSGGLDLTKEKITNYNTLDYSEPDVLMVNHKRTDKGGVKKQPQKIKDRSSEPLFSHEPCMSDVVQDAMGNCFLLSSISELVAKDSHAIMNMMHDDGKTVTVRLYKLVGSGSFTSMKPYYVKVDKRVDEYAATDTLWVQILCKAYAAFVRKHHVISDEKFDDAYGVVDEAMSRSGKEYGKYIEYGFIEGGKTNEVMPVLTGELYKENESIMGSADEVTTDTDVFKIMQESKYTEEQQEQLINSGKFFDLDVAYMEETKDAYGKELKDPIKMVYIKSAFADMEKRLDERLDDLNREYKTYRSKKDRMDNSDIDMKQSRAISYYLKMFASKHLSTYFGTSNYSGAIEDYIAGDPSLGPVETDAAKSVYEEVKKNPKVIFQSVIGTKDADQEYLKAMLDMKDNELWEYINEVLKVTGQTKMYDEMQYSMYYEKKDDKRAPSDPSPEDIKDEKLRMKKACLRITSKCIDDIEKKYMAKRQEIEDLEDDKVKKYQAMIKYVDSLTAPIVHDLSRGYENSFAKLSRLLNLPLNDTLDYIKRILKEKYRIFGERQEEVSNGKSSQLFSGVYNATTLKLYRRIKNDLNDGKRINAGTREGWGKKTSRGETKDKGTVGRHAYSILGVQDVQFKGKTIHMIKVRNPWGSYTLQYFWNEKKKEMEFDSTQADDSGVFYIELTHFSRVFDSLYTTGEKKVEG